MLSADALQDLIARCKFAKTYGYRIAAAEDYARELGYAGEAPPHKVKKFSPAHLLFLAEKAAPAPAAPVPAPTPVKKAAPPATSKEEKPKEKAKPKAKEPKKETAPPPAPVIKPEPKDPEASRVTVPAIEPVVPQAFDRESDMPTAPVDINALHAAVKAMKAPMWEVVLISAGQTPIAVVRELRELLGKDLRDIESIVSSVVPEVLKNDMQQADADALKAKLDAVGAVTEVRPSGELG